MADKKYNIAFKLSDGTTKNVQFSVPYVEVGKDVPSYDEHKNVAERITNNDERIAYQDKRITNLEKGVAADNFVTDDSVAYVKSVPANAAPYAAISKVGGMTRKCTNLFGGEALADKFVEVIPSATKDEVSKSIYFTAVSASKKVFYSDFKENTQYTFVFKIKMSGVGKTSLIVHYTDGTSSVLTNNVGDEIETITFTSAVGKTVDYLGGGNYVNMTIYYGDSGIFEGALTKSDFEPYFEGLRSAPVTEVKVVGSNAANFTDTEGGTGAGVKWSVHNGAVTVSGTATGDSYSNVQGVKTTLPIVAGLIYAKIFVAAENVSTVLRVVRNGTTTYVPLNSSYTVVGDETVIDMYFYVGKGKTADATFYPMITSNGTDLPYAPYKCMSYPIPAEVQALEGYGQGNPENPDEYNAIVWREDGRWAYEHKGNNEDGAWIALDAVEVTDISDLIPADNLIEVEVGGTITFANEHGYAVPSEVIYQTKGAAV